MKAHSEPMTDHATRRGQSAASAEDEPLLPTVVAALSAAGERLVERFSTAPRLGSRGEIFAALAANDAVSLDALREPLSRARPEARWVEDELECGPLPEGEWWVTDTVEGNINHIHGMTDWCVTATLVRDNDPVLTVVHLPLSGDTYTARKGAGAYLGTRRLQASTKSELDAAFVGTGQARPDEDKETFRRIGQSVTAMLGSALVLRVSVPATLLLIQVAAGRMDVFWQYSQIRSGLVAGALLVAEAGGAVTDTRGNPWSLASEDFLAAAPQLHAGVVDVLSTIR
ncbi:inositol phosphatase [Sorangium cellulosum]|uniref:Inositol phosphatase n=1 Tax=Sorangium cellulosum TaxID=56 RepID=A0A2L0ETJ2_SORCE|nr:inositol monophosphatase family protein [Sorangium cellulosum]AUX42628.1 inositol phosphatase [Sorangium cellulosum]